MRHFLKNIKLHYNIKDYRFSLVILVTILSVFGVFMVRSARPDLMDRQIMGVVLGLAAMVVISLIDYKWVLGLYWPLYGLNLVMLIAVPIFGTEANGAKRWLNLGFTQFQPSDLTKILMILFFARFLMDRKEKINSPKTLLQAFALILPSLILIYEQPNLSTTICIAALFCALIFLGGLTYRYILPVIALGGYSISYMARLMRSSLLEVMGQDYIRTARAKGLAERKVIVKHALRNALIPVITVLGPTVANLLTGSFVVEKIFAIPGMGVHFVTSVSQRDYTTIMGMTIFYATFLMVMILIVDIFYCLIDPRIKYE